MANKILTKIVEYAFPVVVGLSSLWCVEKYEITKVYQDMGTEKAKIHSKYHDPVGAFGHKFGAYGSRALGDVIAFGGPFLGVSIAQNKIAEKLRGKFKKKNN